MRYVFLAMMCVFAGVYIFRRNDFRLPGRLLSKGAASVMFVLVAVSSLKGAPDTYYTLVLIGLCLSLAGDVLLVFSDLGDGYFLAGLSAFLAAHIFYVTAFSLLAEFSIYDLAFFAALIIIGFIAFSKLSFGKLKIPVYIYTTVLCAMAAKAVSLLFLNDVNYIYAIFAAIGALLFAFSDLVLAFDKFYPKPKKAFGSINLVLYYSGQALIALSVMI